jgi:hypothetical protein
MHLVNRDDSIPIQITCLTSYSVFKINRERATSIRANFINTYLVGFG